MHLNPEGKKILSGLMIEQFIAPKEIWYDPIRQMKQALDNSEEKTHANAES